MPIIKNDLETEQDVADYKEWLSKKGLGWIKRIKRMLELDKTHRPKQWKNVDLKIQLISDEIKRRGESVE